MSRLQLTWRKLRADETEKELTQRRDFNTDQVRLGETLVREALQNILDQPQEGGSGIINVRFAFSEPTAEQSLLLAPILQPLLPHLRASGMPVDGIDLNRLRFLLIEDFGTTGLTGRWDARDETGGWHAFFRRFGSSPKGGRRGGRWGLGKLVFTSASALRAFIAVTVRAADAEPRSPLMMGQVIAKHHTIDAERYDTHGFLARPCGEGELQLPVADGPAVALFCAAVGLKRSLEPGLSLAIPFPDDQITESSLIGHLLENYFFPLLNGDLMVESGGEKVAADTFDAMVLKYGSPAMRSGKLATFIRTITGRLKGNPDLVAPKAWTAKGGLEAALPDDAKGNVRDLYNAGHTVWVRFPLVLRRQTGAALETHVDVFIQAVAAEEEVQRICVRGMLTLPNEARRWRFEGCAVALIADEAVIEEFLGDAEGPAHTDWNGQEARLNENWSAADKRLAEVRKAPRALYDLVATRAEKRDDRALIDWFSIPRKDGQTPGRTPRKLDGTEPRPNPEEVPPPRREKYRITQCKGGFIVAGASGLQASDLPITVRVTAAYDVLRGDPFKRHSPHDFDFTRGDLDVVTKGCGLRAPAANVIELSADAADFRAVITGFDQRRDLDIQARRLK
jgi:hypothetical protein